MRKNGILLIAAMSTLVTPEANANRIACYGSNGERSLAAKAASADEQVVAALPSLLATLAANSNSDLRTFGVYTGAQAERRNQYTLTDEFDRSVVTITEVSPTAVTLSIERACRSKTAEGWHSRWLNLLDHLETKGFTYQQA